MIGLETLADLADVGSGSPPRVVGGRCLNVRHRGRDCHICVDGCPVDAISVHHDEANAKPVVLGQDACTRCGLCVNSCPTGVFVQADPPELNLPQTIARAPGQVVELACPRKEQPTLSRVPEASVVLAPRCLAALSVPLLLESVTTGKFLWLNDSLCHACPIGEARQAIERNIVTANRWLAVAGHSPSVHSYLGAADQLEDELTSRPLVSGDRQVLSRRELFRSLTGRAAVAASVAEGDVFPSDDAARARKAKLNANQGDAVQDTGRLNTHHIPTQRQHLARALRGLSPDPMARVPSAALPIGDVIVTDSCTACGLCARFCPTEAIVFLNDDEYYVLHFSAALCLGEECRLCIIGCPTDAVHFGQEVMADELLSTQPRPLKAGRLAPCSRCGAPTDAPMDGDESAEVSLCYVCQARADLADQSSNVSLND